LPGRLSVRAGSDVPENKRKQADEDEHQEVTTDSELTSFGPFVGHVDIEEETKNIV
jgi:hypothetical protein